MDVDTLMSQIHGSSFRIIGGAVWPDKIAASWPLAVLLGDGTGLRIDLRWSLSKRIFTAIFSSTFQEQTPINEAWWTSTWDELATVKLAGRSVVLINNRGSSCRFITMSSKKLRPFIDLLERRGIAVERVRSTILWMWRNH
jgi:hypothetical protein